MYTVEVSSNQGQAVKVRADTLFEMVEIVWPLVLHWKRQCAKKPDADVAFHCDGTGWSIQFRYVKRDKVHDAIGQMLGYYKQA